MIGKAVLFAALMAGACGSVLGSAQAGTSGTWMGYYVGVNAGYGGGQFKWPVTATFVAPPTNLTATGTAQLNSSGFMGGVQMGYNFVWDSGWLFGVEADFDGSTVQGKLGLAGTLTGTTTANAFVSAGSKIDYFGTARPRLGYFVTDNVLLYGTAGLAYGSVQTGYNINVVSGGATLFAGTKNVSNMQIGWTVGAGVDYPISDVLTFKVEYLYVDLGKKNLINSPFAILGGTGNVSLGTSTTANVLRVGWDYHLN